LGVAGNVGRPELEKRVLRIGYVRQCRSSYRSATQETPRNRLPDHTASQRRKPENSRYLKTLRYLAIIQTRDSYCRIQNVINTEVTADS
jgi:hypothetical protein